MGPLCDQLWSCQMNHHLCPLRRMTHAAVLHLPPLSHLCTHARSKRKVSVAGVNRAHWTPSSHRRPFDTVSLSLSLCTTEWLTVQACVYCHFALRTFNRYLSSTNGGVPCSSFVLLVNGCASWRGARETWETFRSAVFQGSVLTEWLRRAFCSGSLDSKFENVQKF